MNLSTPFVIFSASRSALSAEENAERTGFMRAQLEAEGIPVVDVDGFYNGYAEKSFLAYTYEGTAESRVIERLAALYKQDAILYVDANRLAYLRYADNQPNLELGMWREVSAYDAGRSRSYTYIRGKYYTAGDAT